LLWKNALLSREGDNDNGKECKYVCITNNQQDTKSNPNSNPTVKQHAVVSTQLNIVTCATYPEKFTRDSVIAPFLLPSVVIVTLSLGLVVLVRLLVRPVLNIVVVYKCAHCTSIFFYLLTV